MECRNRLDTLIRLPTGSPLWHHQPELRYHTIDEGRETWRLQVLEAPTLEEVFVH